MILLTSFGVWVFFSPWAIYFICFIIAPTALKGGMEENLL